MSNPIDNMDNDTLASFVLDVYEYWEQELRRSEKPGENFDPIYSTISEELVLAGVATSVVSFGRAA